MSRTFIMHGKSSRGRRYVGLAGVYLLTIAGPQIAWGQAEPVVVAPVIERDITIGQTFVGTVEPNKRSIVGSAVDGRVVRMPVEEGDYLEFDAPPKTSGGDSPEVKAAGEILAQLRTGTIDIMVNGARAELLLRQHELAELEAGTRLEELEQRQAEFDRALALRDYAKKRYSRLESLDRAVTKEEVDQAYSAWIAAEQNLKAAEAAVALAEEGPRREQKDQAAARLQMQQDALELLEDRRRKYTIRAPFEGYVVAKHTEIGAWIQVGDPVAEVISIDPAQVTVSVPEAAIEGLRRGSDVTLRFEGLGEKLFRGEVFRIIPQADERSRAYPVTVRLDNPRRADQDHVIKAGMLAHATIGQRHHALLVPKDALVLGGPRPIVYATEGAAQAGQDVNVRAVTVEIGVAYGDLTQVAGELRAGQTVVVQGNERLRGNKIRVLNVLPATPQ